MPLVSDSVTNPGTSSLGEAVRSIHISYAPQQRRNIWTFTDREVLRGRGLSNGLSKLNHFVRYPKRRKSTVLRVIANAKHYFLL